MYCVTFTETLRNAGTLKARKKLAKWDEGRRNRHGKYALISVPGVGEMRSKIIKPLLSLRYRLTLLATEV